jgi:hypothetical protein
MKTEDEMMMDELTDYVPNELTEKEKKQLLLAAMLAMWYWDIGSARYRNADTGRFMARSEVLAYVDQMLTASASATDTLARLVSGGLMSPSDWGAAMRQEIKEEYIRQYILGRGGVAQMTAEDWGSIGGTLQRQFWYLDRKDDSFLDAVARGELSEAQIRARAKLYVNSARQAYERGNRRAQIGAGMTEVKWTLQPAEHCEDCVALAAMGWQLIADDPYGGCFPASGCTICQANCKCILEYRELEER